jgi:hypothetical protein
MIWRNLSSAPEDRNERAAIVSTSRMPGPARRLRQQAHVDDLVGHGLLDCVSRRPQSGLVAGTNLCMDSHRGCRDRAERLDLLGKLFRARAPPSLPPLAITISVRLPERRRQEMMVMAALRRLDALQLVR